MEYRKKKYVSGNKVCYKMVKYDTIGRPKKIIDNKEEILEYRKTHNIKETCEHFNISRYLLKKMVQPT